MDSDSEFNDLDLDRLPGICADNYQNGGRKNIREDKIQNSPKPQDNPFQIQNEKNSKIDNIPEEEDFFTFKNNINNKNKNRKEKIFNADNYRFNYNTELSNNINNNNEKGIENDILKTDVINFDDLKSKRNKERNNNKSRNKNDKIKIDFSRKLYQNKKNCEERNDEKKVKAINKKNNNIINNFSPDKFYKPNNKTKRDKIEKFKLNDNNDNAGKEIRNKNNEREKNLLNYFKLDNTPKKKKSNFIMKYKNHDIIFNFENFKEDKNKSFIINKNNKYNKDNSLTMNKSRTTLKSIKSTSRKINKIDIMNEMEKKVNLALNNGGNKNLIKRHSYINDNKKNFDNSKFEKYNTEKMRYELIKDYSFIHPEINENFLERMEFDLMKRKNKETKLNEFVEKNKNKYKLNENKRNKAFNRLIEDANRRNIMKQEIIENERLLTDYKSILDNEKKYNQEDWNKIYNKRFKEYEDIKKKKIDIQRQNEKIKKMIKEEEEINMCKIKKMPLNKIKETSNRLYNESKKREYLRSNRSFISDKNTNNFMHDKNKINFTNFNDEEDASRYMKNYKPEEYSFISNKRNIFDDNENNFFKKKNYNEIFNKSFDRRNLKKNSRITNTEFNNLRFNTNNSYIIPYKKTKKVNLTPLNNTRKFKNNIQNYFNFKNNKKEINQLENEYIHNPTMPCEYNYNNYNIYNINNLNNNFNSNFNNNVNNIDNDNDYLNNITNQILKSAALNKIDINENPLSLREPKIPKNKLINNENIVNNSQNERDDIIEQFLSSQFQSYE